MNKEKKLTKVEQWIEDHPWDAGYFTASIIAVAAVVAVDAYRSRTYCVIKKKSPLGEVLMKARKDDSRYWVQTAESLVANGIDEGICPDGTTVKHTAAIFLGHRLEKK